MAHRLPHTRFVAAALVAAAVACLPLHTSRAASPAASPAAPAAMTPIRMAFSTWTGYGPLVVGVDTGIFKKYGLNVTYTVVEDPNARFAAFKAGSLDGIATTVDTFTRQAAPGAKVVQVFGIDRSVGGDGIVAKKHHQRQAAQRQDRRRERRLDQRVVPGLRAAAERHVGQRRQHPGYARQRRGRLDVPRRQGGRGGDLGALAEPRQQAAASATCWSPARRIPISSSTMFGFRTDFIKAHPDVVSDVHQSLLRRRRQGQRW